MTMRKTLAFLTMIVFAGVLPAFAGVVYPSGSPDPSNVVPPAGPILDLAGGSILSGYNLYSVSFTATLTNTDVTFAFRNDPGFTYFDDASIVDTTTPSGNLFQNPGFETGNLTDWTYDNVFGAPFGGAVNSECSGGLGSHGGTFFWCDGATQAYDAIDQIVPTTIGDSYTISFFQNQFDTNGVAESIYQQLSTNGCVDTSSCGGGTLGNGIDTLVYVGGTIPPPGTPEPSTLLMFGTGLLTIGGMVRRRLSL